MNLWSMSRLANYLLLEHFGLVYSTRESVDEEACGAVPVLLHGFLDELQGYFNRNQLPIFHQLFTLLPYLCTIFHLITQQVACWEMQVAEVAYNSIALRSFPRARTTCQLMGRIWLILPWKLSLEEVRHHLGGNRWYIPRTKMIGLPFGRLGLWWHTFLWPIWDVNRAPLWAGSWWSAMRKKPMTERRYCVGESPHLHQPSPHESHINLALLCSMSTIWRCRLTASTLSL